MTLGQVYKAGATSHPAACGVLFVVYATLFLWMADFSDTCIFGGDVWDYQTLAVNLAHGHPLALDEVIEPFDAHRFALANPRDLRFFGFDSIPAMVTYYHQRSGYNTERTPGYYVFLAGVYRIFGVHPRIVKQLQLLMLCFVSAFLPLLCRSWWGARGWWFGLVGGLVYLTSAWRLAGALMTESLCALMAFALLASIERDGRRKSWHSAALLGGVCGVANLVKGCFYFVPWMIAGLLLWQAFRRRSLKTSLRAGIVCLSFMLTIAPWSLYISRVSGRRVLLSTMGPTFILDSNNEACLDGGYHPERRLDPQRSAEFFYNRPEFREVSTLGKVARFYATYPLAFGFIMTQKVVHGFLQFFSVWVWLGACVLGAMSGFSQRHLTASPGESSRLRARLPDLCKGAVVLLVVAVAPLLHYAFPPNGSLELSQSCWLQPDITEPIVWGLAVLVLICCRGLVRTLRAMPSGCQIMLASFLVITLVFYGSVRFLIVIDFMMLSLALKQAADCLVGLVVETRTARLCDASSGARRREHGSGKGQGKTQVT